MTAPHKMRRYRMLGFVLSISINALKIHVYLLQDADDRRIFFTANSRAPHHFRAFPSTWASETRGGSAIGRRGIAQGGGGSLPLGRPSSEQKVRKSPQRLARATRASAG